MRAEGIAYVFHALSDATRLRIVNLLLHAGDEVTVGEVVDSLEERQYNVSKHLRVLRAAGLVRERRQGRFVHLRLVPAEDAFRRKLYEAVRSLSGPDLQGDREELVRRLMLRTEGQTTVGLAKKNLASRAT